MIKQVRFDFTGLTVLVIGATSGIGEATVTAFVDAGANVVFGGMGGSAGEAIENRLNVLRPGCARFLETDVRNEAQLARLMGCAVDHFGSIDIAVNNAGIEGPFGPVQGLSEADADGLWDVNLKGIWRGMRLQISHMLAQGKGVIVNTASSAGLVSIPQVAMYSATKHAIVGLTKAAALELARSNIRVNAVAPGPVRTPLLDRMVGGHVPLEAIASMVPMGRISEPHETAAAILWLCSDAASFVVGHTLVVDGGLTVA